MNWTFRMKLQCDLNRNQAIFTQENVHEIVVWKLAGILARPQLVDMFTIHDACNDRSFKLFSFVFCHDVAISKGETSKNSKIYNFPNNKFTGQSLHEILYVNLITSTYMILEMCLYKHWRLNITSIINEYASPCYLRSFGSEAKIKKTRVAYYLTKWSLPFKHFMFIKYTKVRTNSFCNTGNPTTSNTLLVYMLICDNFMISTLVRDSGLQVIIIEIEMRYYSDQYKPIVRVWYWYAFR